jgi:glycosyltransferase involved in cell wall biosynthesis
LEGALARRPGRVLLQYTPHAFGWKAMNVPLCAWLWVRREKVDVMFHEVAFPFKPGQPWKHSLLAAVQRGMASLLIRGAQRVFVSIPGWGSILDRLAPKLPHLTWTPVPSALPVSYTPHELARVRSRLLPDPSWRLVGHFGTYGHLITPMLAPALVEVLSAGQGVRVVLLGRGGPAFAADFNRKNPELACRLLATGELDAHSAGAHVASCDVLLQPYPDGISSRRTSAMAALALGCPIVTTAGEWTEPIWRESKAVVIATATDLAAAVLALLDDPERRIELGRQAAALYRSQFAVEHTIRALRKPL